MFETFSGPRSISTNLPSTRYRRFAESRREIWVSRSNFSKMSRTSCENPATYPRKPSATLGGSSRTLRRSSSEAFQNWTPVMFVRTGPTLESFPCSCPCLSRTFCLVGARTPSRRRNTVSGKITLPYSDCL